MPIWTWQSGIVVIDELHTVGDAMRGTRLELLIATLLQAAPHIQIIGMSATVPNVDQLGKWIDAQSFVNAERLENELINR